MRGKGICYDAGFILRGVSSREPFDPSTVRREMQIIRNDLHCIALLQGFCERGMLKRSPEAPP
jgi:hypothetical protein